MLTLPSESPGISHGPQHDKHRHTPSLSPISSFAFLPRPWVFPPSVVTRQPAGPSEGPGPLPAGSSLREARRGEARGRRPPPCPGDSHPEGRRQRRRRSPRPPRRPSEALSPPAAPVTFKRLRPPLFSSGARRTARRSPGGRGRAAAAQPGQRDTSPPLLHPPPPPSCAAARHGAGCGGAQALREGNGGARSSRQPGRRGAGRNPGYAATPGRAPAGRPALLGGGIRAALWAEGYGEEPAARSAGALSPVAG